MFKKKLIIDFPRRTGHGNDDPILGYYMAYDERCAEYKGRYLTVAEYERISFEWAKENEVIAAAPPIRTPKKVGRRKV
jgi:hypothetical protein